MVSVIRDWNIDVCYQGSTEGRKLVLLSTEKISKLFDYVDNNLSLDNKKNVDKIHIYLTDSMDFFAKIDGRKDPETGEVLTAYGWEYDDGVLGIPIYIKQGYLKNVDSDYLDGMVSASIWYFLVDKLYWQDNENFGSSVFRDMYINSLIKYERLVEIK